MHMNASAIQSNVVLAEAEAPLIYRLDPRTKLLCLMIYSVLTLVFFDLHINFLLFLLLPLLWLHARIRGKKARNLILSSLGYALVIFITQLVFVPHKIANSTQIIPARHLFSLFFIEISDVSLDFALTITMRMCLPLLAAVIVILTSDSMHIVRSLSKMGLPASIILVIASTFRLMPLAFEEMSNIQEAQRVRGLKSSKMTALKTTLFPWLISLLRMARNIGLSVESKGFSNRRRKANLYREPQMAAADYGMMAIGVFALLIGLYVRFGLGWGASSMTGFF
jgi:energy-coupling factor transport system permease protein